MVPRRVYAEASCRRVHTTGLTSLSSSRTLTLIGASALPLSSCMSWGVARWQWHPTCRSTLLPVMLRPLTQVSVDSVQYTVIYALSSMGDGESSLCYCYRTWRSCVTCQVESLEEHSGSQRLKWQNGEGHMALAAYCTHTLVYLRTNSWCCRLILSDLSRCC